MPFEDPGAKGERRPPPDPLDRLWMHPSELPSPLDAPAGPAQRRRGRDWLLLVAAGALGAMIAVAVLAATGVIDRANPADPITAQPVATLAARGAPGVVGVVAATAGAQRRGSGLTLTDDWVLTSSSIVDGSATITVLDATGDPLTATLYGRDGITGLALLHVEGITATVGPDDPAPVAVGDTIIALGAGSDDHNWIATGVVSSVSAVLVDNEVAQTGLIGTDAAIVPAAAGGALLNDRGRVVGILALAPDRRGLAVPIERARTVAAQLRETRHVAHGWIGIAGADATEEPGGGVLVSEVTADGPAEKSGIMTGDIVIGAEGDRIATMADLMSIARSHDPDERLALEIRRHDQTLNLRVRLGDVPRDARPGDVASNEPLTPPSTTLAAASAQSLAPVAVGSG